MIRINPDNMRMIKLTIKEQETILTYCQTIDRDTCDRIVHARNGVLHLLTDECYDLQNSIYIAIEQTSNNEVKDILGHVFNKLSSNTSGKNFADEIEGKDFDSIELLNDHLQDVMTKRNSAPDPEMGGLSPDQVSALIYTNWEDDTFPLKFNKSISLEDIEHSRFFNNTRLFLNTLIELSNETTATATGNLNRKIVKLIFDKMEMDEDNRAFTLKYNKVINEIDVFPLHIIKIVCEQAGIIKKRAKKFYVVKKHQSLLSDKKAGELYYLLFYNYFRKFNLGYLDRFTELECIQKTLGYSLYRLREVCGDYQKVEKMPKEIFLPTVMNEIEKNPLLQRIPDWIVLSRIIRPLEGFGLIECSYKGKRGDDEIKKVRKSELFDRFVGVEWK